MKIIDFLPIWLVIRKLLDLSRAVWNRALFKKSVYGNLTGSCAANRNFGCHDEELETHLIFDNVSADKKIRMAKMKFLAQRERSRRLTPFVIFIMVVTFSIAVWMMLIKLRTGIKAIVPACQPACFFMRQQLFLASLRSNGNCCWKVSFTGYSQILLDPVSEKLMNGSFENSQTNMSISSTELRNVKAFMQYCNHRVFTFDVKEKKDSTSGTTTAVYLDDPTEPSSNPTMYSVPMDDVESVYLDNDNKDALHVGRSLCNSSIIDSCRFIVHNLAVTPDIGECIDYHVVGITFSIQFIYFVFLFTVAFILLIALMSLLTVIYKCYNQNLLFQHRVDTSL